MKINITKELKNLTGELIVSKDEKSLKTEPLTVGLVLANILLSAEPKDGFRPLKSYELAKKFYGENAKHEEVEIDNADFVQIKALVESNKQYNTIIIAQTLEMLEGAKDK